MTARSWHTAAALAGLPGMPSTSDGVRRRAQREGWAARRRSGRGGGQEYHLNALPEITQAALARRDNPGRRRPQNVSRESLWAAYERAPAKAKAEAKRRADALRQIEHLVGLGAPRLKAQAAIAAQLETTPSTLRRWQKKVRGLDSSDWPTRLLDGYRGRTARAECSPEAWDFFKAQYLRPEAPNASTCYAWLREAAIEHGWAVPSYATLRRRIRSDVPRAVRVLSREGEDALMRLYPALERDVSGLHALEWINGDGYTHNVWVVWPDGTVARPKTWFWQDVYSRMIVAHRTDRSEHMDLIRQATGDVFDQWGIPDHVTIDNTRAAANKYLTGGVPNRYRFKIKADDPLGLFPQFGIELHWTSVRPTGSGHGQAKPQERAFGVGGFGEYIDKHPAFSGAYTGASPVDKPENYRSRAIPLETFLKVLTDGIRAWNARRGRRTQICGGVASFQEVFMDSYRKAPVRGATSEQRRLWLLAAESIPVRQDGTISLKAGRAAGVGDNRYAADCLLEFAGQRVVVRFDPDNLHNPVYVYSLDGRYIGDAECVHAAGFGDRNTARAHSRARKQFVRATKQATEAERRMGVLEAATLMPDSHEPEDPAPRQVTRLTQRRSLGSAAPELTPEDEHDENDDAFSTAVADFEARLKRGL